jgi:hypothetical protein
LLLAVRQGCCRVVSAVGKADWESMAMTSSCGNRRVRDRTRSDREDCACSASCSDRGRALCQRLNSLAMSQEAHIVENYGNRSTRELKRLPESLIDSAN